MKTIEKLQRKATSSFSDKCRMPSISEIAKMLTELGVAHSVTETKNIVEYRSKGNRYVNSRHDGKKGKGLVIEEAGIFMDTSDSYYSWNTNIYADKILKFLKEKRQIMKTDFTKTERIEILREARKDVEKDCCICTSIKRSMIIMKYHFYSLEDVRTTFPEILKYKPDGAKINDAWFPLYEEGKATRLRIMDEMIAMEEKK